MWTQVRSLQCSSRADRPSTSTLRSGDLSKGANVPLQSNRRRRSSRTVLEAMMLQCSAVPRSATVSPSFKPAIGATLQLAVQFNRVRASEGARSEDRATFWSRKAHHKPSPDHTRGEEAVSSLDSQPVLQSEPHSGLNTAYCDQYIVTGSISAPALPRGS